LFEDCSFFGGERRNGRHGLAASPNLSKPFAKGWLCITVCASQRWVALLYCPAAKFFAPHCATVSVIRSEANGNGAVLPDAVRKHSKEELIAFFRDIQTSIAESSPKASRRTKKPSPEPFQEVDKRRQSYGMDGDGSADDFSEERERAINLEDMKMAELRELARARRMRGYSKLNKGELIDRLRGVTM
ncbi:unnamed protein product, partial [Urochloa humidicola]